MCVCVCWCFSSGKSIVAGFIIIYDRGGLCEATGGLYVCLCVRVCVCVNNKPPS